MVTPPYLKPGDAIGITSTARKITTEELGYFLNLVKEWGLKPVLGATIDSQKDQFAGDDALRTAEFQKFLDDPDIKAIWCARGGYGTVRIVDSLDFTEFRRNPKWIVGYSDVTVLHSHIHTFGIETLHANMPSEMEKKTAATRNTAKNVLFGEPYSLQYSDPSPLNRAGTARGQLVGGNLSILYSLTGSPSALETKGKVLFIEDLDEYLYHIDRMMQNLKRNNMLEHLAGLIVGGFSDMHDNKVPFGQSAPEIVHEIVRNYNFPVSFNFPAGHIKDNRALILGRTVDLVVTSENTTVKF